MIDLDATQPIILSPTVPDIPLTVQRRTYRRRRPMTWLRVVLLWLHREASDWSHTLIMVVLLALLVVLMFACAAVVP